VFRNDERTKLNLRNEKITAENLSDVTTNKEMQPLKITIPRNEEFTSDEYKHRGEEFGYVLKGEGILKLKNKIKDHVIKPGDSFYLHSHLFDRIINSGKEDLEIIWISTPPTI
jgi:mannose-6-phosphate isomerase-like protein (cupin superfamily)